MSDLVSVTWMTHHGREFKVETYVDYDSGPPWKDDECTGVVTTRSHHGYHRFNKRPWERVLGDDRGDIWLYDMRATRQKAKEQGWGLGEAQKAKLAERLGRRPTPNEVVCEAIEQNFQHIRGYLNERWCYVGVTVTDTLSGDEDSLWGIESSPDEYLEGIIQELASGLHPLAEREDCCVLGEN